MGTLSEQQAKQNIKYLLDYASERLFLQECDRILAENTLLDILGLDAPFDGETEKDKSVYDALSELSAYAASKKLCAEDARLRFETKLMGVDTFALAHYRNVIV